MCIPAFMSFAAMVMVAIRKGEEECMIEKYLYLLIICYCMLYLSFLRYFSKDGQKFEKTEKI